MEGCGVKFTVGLDEVGIEILEGLIGPEMGAGGGDGVGCAGVGDVGLAPELESDALEFVRGDRCRGVGLDEHRRYYLLDTP